jgi:23S rRNA (adenine2503-C2)-methyltransferase
VYQGAERFGDVSGMNTSSPTLPNPMSETPTPPILTSTPETPTPSIPAPTPGIRALPMLASTATPTLPMLAPAPETSEAARGWALLPEDLRRLGYPRDADSLFAALQRVDRWEGGRPVLGKAARQLLEGISLELPGVIERHPSEDLSQRLVLRTHDGHAIEAVHMPRAVKNPRVTLCISSQVGCAMACTFCATGTMGIVRNLTAGEIVGQVLAVMLALGPRTGHQLNLVFMGMGEPLHNLTHVARAIEVLCHPLGVGMSPSRITVSTSGLVPGIERLAQLAVRPLLAVSINATTDEMRSALMPVNRVYPLARLRETLCRFPLRQGQKILLEYVLIEGKNDADADAEGLAAFALGFRHNVNVIPLNEHAGTTDRAPADARVLEFARRLTALGCFCTVRNNRGRDVRGACGQLVSEARRPPGRRPPSSP